MCANDAVLLPLNAPAQRGRTAIRTFWEHLKAYTLKLEVGSDTVEGGATWSTTWAIIVSPLFPRTGRIREWPTKASSWEF